MSAAMSSCERVIDVEDLVLGLVRGADADALEAHLDVCADCQDAKAMFTAERALFEARPARDDEDLPPLVVPKPALGHVYRFVPALVAAAACVAVFFGRPHTDDCEPPTPAVAAALDDGPGICRAPDAPAPAVSLASHDTNACVPSPNATCDVTNSTATP